MTGARGPLSRATPLLRGRGPLALRPRRATDTPHIRLGRAGRAETLPSGAPDAQALLEAAEALLSAARRASRDS